VPTTGATPPLGGHSSAESAAGWPAIAPLMHTFSERLRVKDCKQLIHELDPLDLVEHLRFFPIEKVNTKKDTIEIIYLHNPRARFGGKAKTKVTVTAGENSLRLHGLGPVSFELRLSCTTPRTLVVYYTVTGKLIDRIPKSRAYELFQALLAELRSRAGVEEAPTQPAAAAAGPPVSALLVTPAASAPAAAAPGATTLSSGLTSTPASSPAPVASTPTPVPGAAGGTGVPGEDLAGCIVRLITAGFPVDEELSRRTPREYSPRLRSLPVVAHGYEASERINLIEYLQNMQKNF
jgi:hypothetical protein